MDSCPDWYADKPLQKALLLLLCIVSVRAGLLADAERWVPETLISAAYQDYGREAGDTVSAWREELHRLSGSSEKEKLIGVNRFINNAFPFVSDLKHWQKDDYWATPFESIATRGGDCEDYVIAKYYSLRQLGVDTNKLRITYVKAIRLNQAHMVLTYFPQPDAIPYVLDNLTGKILPASERPDLSPVYSFNGEGMWLERMKGEGIRMGNPNKLDLWTDLRIRMNELGMDL
ncbi:MAG: sulfate adenylyltransferase [Oceanospirillaceae bacterium]|nr:sulfate adenylyltransferase [Oceanospirillaceae bacterium]MBT13448.1 sulfate adenylyltransferase [Oceanospirillaceae bacterium]